MVAIHTNHKWQIISFELFSFFRVTSIKRKPKEKDDFT